MKSVSKLALFKKANAMSDSTMLSFAKTSDTAPRVYFGLDLNSNGSGLAVFFFFDVVFHELNESTSDNRL